MHFVQKISGPKLGRYIDPFYFLREQFSVAIEATIFRIERRAIEAQRLQSIFTFSLLHLQAEYSVLHLVFLSFQNEYYA